MKVKCISNTSNSLSEKAAYPKNYHCESLVIEQLYKVYSIGNWDNYMFYLLKVDHQDSDLNLDPVWFPYEWFEITEHKFPDSWYFNFIGEPMSEQISTIVGYKEIVLNYDHHYGIIEREKEHLDLFYKMKASFDK